MKRAMRHFFVRAEMRKHTNDKPHLIDADYERAAHLATLVAPYRHARLSAVKVAGDPSDPMRMTDNATTEELKAEIMKHLTVLAPVLDLEVPWWRRLTG